MRSRILCSALLFIGIARADLVLAGKNAPALPIVLPAAATAANRHAAEELAEYVERICGSRPVIQEQAAGSAIWIGIQPGVAERFPGVELTFAHPEEILIVATDTDLLIAGRDQLVAGEQTEFGTAHAVSTFLEKQLGVRWLWPGPLGEDVIPQETISLAPLTFRFHPPFRQRRMWRGQYSGVEGEQAAAWFRLHRAEPYSLRFNSGHAFTKWWNDYHEEHPDYFALQPDGSRDAYPDAKNVKLCISNPAVQAQWLNNAEAAFKADPQMIMASASPNDGSTSGVCVCENCRAWDNPNGAEMTYYGKGGRETYVMITDRQVTFWNILARGLRERFPDREAWVGAYAYGPYRTPPVSATLEPNVAIGYVGHFPMANDEVRQQEQAAWKGWADKATAMVFRPNLFHYSGGWLGLHSATMHRTVSDFRFLADNKCIGLAVDTWPLNWATQGVQHYTMIEAAYDPYLDVDALLADYYQRGFGPAAEQVAAYFALMEAVHDEILLGIKHSSAFGQKAIDFYQAAYTPEILAKSEALLDQAAIVLAAGPAKFSERLAFVRYGHDFVKLQVEIMGAMDDVRETVTKESMHHAVALCEKRDAMRKDAPPFALRGAEWYTTSRRLADYIGPPSAELQAAAEVE